MFDLCYSCLFWCSMSIHFSGRSSFLFWPWLVCSIHTTEEPFLLHWLSYMHLHLELRATLQHPSIVSWKEQTGYVFEGFIWAFGIRLCLNGCTDWPLLYLCCVAGEKSAIDRMLVLRTFVSDVLLPQYCCNCLQCNGCSSIWHNCCHSPYMDTCDITLAGIGWNCWEE